MLWGGGINSDRTLVLMYVGYRYRNFRGRHVYWRLVHHHRVGGVNNDSVWVGIWAAFGNPYMEAILSFGVPKTLNTIWDTSSKPKARGEVASQETYVNTERGTRKVCSQGDCYLTRTHCVLYKDCKCSPYQGGQGRIWVPRSWGKHTTKLNR